MPWMQAIWKNELPKKCILQKNILQKWHSFWPTDVMFKSLDIFILESNIGRRMTKMRRNPNEPGRQPFLLVLACCKNPTLVPFRVFTKVAPTLFCFVFFSCFSLFFLFLLFFWGVLSGFHLRKQMEELNHDRLRNVSWKIADISKMRFPYRLKRRHHGHHLSVD